MLSITDVSSLSLIGRVMLKTVTIANLIFNSLPFINPMFETSKYLRSFVLIPCLFLSSVHVAAERVLVPAAPDIAGKAWLLMDAYTGKVLVEHNADERLPPASLTKMMTTYIVSEEIAAGRLKETDLVKVSDDAWQRGGSASGGSTMFLQPRSEVPVIELMKGVIIPSGNDAAIALAQHVAGGEDAFADVMNQQAQLLGMLDTNYLNATGWPAENHYTTARDLSILARAVIFDHPEHYKLYAEKYYKHNGINQPNFNQLLFKDNTVDGIKTGHTESAGYCLVASATRDDMRLISVVMGTASKNARVTASQKLLSYGFRYYHTLPLYKNGDVVSKKKVWKATVDEVELGIQDDLLVTIPRGSHKDISAEMHVNSILEAPLAKGAVVGSVLVTLDGEELAKIDLHVMQDVKKAGFFASTWDSILLMFESEEEPQTN